MSFCKGAGFMPAPFSSCYSMILFYASIIASNLILGFNKLDIKEAE